MKKRSTLPAAVCALLLSGCSQSSGTSTSVDHLAASHILKPEDLRRPIVDEARARDKEIVDGWYFGELPRIFKSAYAKVPADLKAKFAVEYHSFLERSGENIEVKWDSYVPYSRRSDFARTWWMQADQDFNKQEAKMKVVWLHEALMDASELWFRAMEKTVGDDIQSTTVLAHDHEQKLVSEYSEDEGHPGSFSTQPR